MSIWALMHFWLLVGWLVFVVLWMTRSLVVGRHNDRAIRIISQHKKGLLYAGLVKNEELEELIDYSLVHRNSTLRSMLDFRKWTFAQLYPEIVSYPVTAALLGYPDIDGMKWEAHMGRAYLGRGATRI